ncbi:tripartite tricarboxylate transporter TctB family protein [Xenorhabdus bovienii]|uniref:TctB protein n=2 Tax=Xenorhabdus bovienii TaxID=40576 RepID=A0A077PKU6_XENBV|nr:tripartite tricarboxylate transporter TctB family protein [Xenorhabdus bovienii]MDE9427395.1 tripartite tricarboxylate transporter TctB family protein [Xenorhabdus bovienii]MDE9456390.1 tripartite tricarboxylate transporter TctB family protein [Xenorhabdus bovienii]MDE9464117.1 tripartite tricarboxylate transporter TctB family protein [Xenorhabdus bovienii]MDE9484624.1 tripartite tricarboxylate transporter TctB family protein [Xenorhabdus bovienii]MDE9494336.1 tripartite tricarboxylate tran
MSDRIFAVVWLVLCGIGLTIGWGIHSEYSYEPLGPRPFPIAIISLMALCSLLLLFKKPEPTQWPTAQVLRRLLLLITSLVVYAWTFEWLGFPLATTLLTISVALLFNAKLPAAIISGVFLGVSLFFAFDRLLDVTLPLGNWLK